MPDETTKQCATCGEPKVLSQFPRSRSGAPKSRCKKCEGKRLSAALRRKQAEIRSDRKENGIYCRLCEQTKPATTEFFCIRDGVFELPCRFCRYNRFCKPWKEAHPERVRAARRKYDTKPQSFIRRKSWRCSERGAICQKARRALQEATRRGKLQRPSVCQFCGQTCSAVAYHYLGYSKPLDVLWLCSKCHGRARGCDPEEVEREVRVRQLASITGVSVEIANRLVVTRSEFEVIHSEHQNRLALEAEAERAFESRIAKLSPSARLLELRRRAIFAGWSNAKNPNTAVTLCLQREGWFDPGPPPFDLVLGCWVRNRPNAKMWWERIADFDPKIEKWIGAKRVMLAGQPWVVGVTTRSGWVCKACDEPIGLGETVCSRSRMRVCMRCASPGGAPTWRSEQLSKSLGDLD